MMTYGDMPIHTPDNCVWYMSDIYGLRAQNFGWVASSRIFYKRYFCNPFHGAFSPHVLNLTIR